jgi:transposase-like protein
MTNYIKPEQYIAIQYLAQAKNGGLTHEEIAKKAGVSRATVFNWKKQPLFERELKAEMVRQSRNRIPEVIERLADMVINEGNAAAAKLLLQMNGMLSEKVEVTKAPYIEEDNTVDYDSLDDEIEAFSKRMDFEESNEDIINE